MGGPWMELRRTAVIYRIQRQVNSDHCCFFLCIWLSRCR